ncbi:hypothetical protein TpMuguga_03g00148 [Theileria parva strain Muguga]|uniref:Uncharacterized protein n=1 Tax=Theileria parva TaxID=5875 RepID=Q4N0I8_THEPA|nr:uncharacterized protein TpMuguga_03g00148 [Theileria parva strain Muguga]EAN30883.1 hypothetical protein TpMuguga_03g00148 [Theileria parva strain Muguga]|eukprot:XP_763166.1 hypothetical protein [Theileria parva strain Muguga]
MQFPQNVLFVCYFPHTCLKILHFTFCQFLWICVIMYMNKIFLFTLFLANIQEIFATGEVQAGTKQDVNVDLRRFKEHCRHDENDSKIHLKAYVCEPGDTKTFLKVFYEDTDLWNSSTTDGKTFKKLVVYVKQNFLQLLHLTLTKDGRDEDLYYKKNKLEFPTLVPDEFTKQKTELEKTKYYLDQWFLLDMGNKDFYLNHVAETESLLDGVEKKLFSVSKGKPSFLREGTQKVWEDNGHAKGLTSAELYDFGNHKLLLLNLGGENKFFVKSNSTQPQSQWTSLDDRSAFDTKVSQFKSRYFSNNMEYDLAQKPDLNKLSLRRSSFPGNLNELTLTPTREYLLNKVKYNQTDLWTPGGTQKRVFMMRLTLLGFEVRAAALFVTDSRTKLTPVENLHYYYKENGTFREVNRDEYKRLVKVVKSLSDKTSTFTYNSDWVHRAGRLDATLYNDAELNVHKQEDASKGLVTTTLTPKDNFEFTSLSYGTLPLWPTAVRATTGVVKNVEVVAKDSLVQLVRLTLRLPSNYTLHLKKDEDEFTSVDSSAYDSYKELLKDPNYYVDNKVHLDVNDESLNPKFYKVVKSSADGVSKKVVTVENLKVHNVKAFGHSLWNQRDDKHEFAKKYEFFSVGDSNLLLLHLETKGRRQTKKFFKKQDPNTQWVEMGSESQFNSTLASFKLANRPVKVDLDLSTKPLTTDYSVDVTSLSGSRTMLVLTPVKGKVVGKLKFKETNLWTSDATSRGVKVHVYLEDYDVKFAKLDVLTTQNNQDQQSEVKRKWTSDTEWVETNFDTDLDRFKTEDNHKPFKYNSNWQLPSNKFDTKSFLPENFTVSDVTSDLVKTTTYTPQTWMRVNEVLVDELKVWPLGSDAVDETKRLKLLEVLSKDHMVQLVRLQNVLLTTPETTEDLYYKKEALAFVKLDDVTKFDELKKKLSQDGQYVDDKVKLDLSSEVPTTMFSSETVLEDGLEKTVVEVKVGKLYQVQASPPLWTSENGEYVTKLEKYSKGDRQFLVLHLEKDGQPFGKKYFEKPTTQQPQDAASQREGQGQGTEQARQETQVAAARPSFQQVQSNTDFYRKLKEVKATVRYTEVSLDLNSYQDQKFLLKESTVQMARLYELYPKAEYRVKSLVFGSKELWTKTKDDERLVEAKLYVHDSKTKLVKAVVWEGDQSDDTTSTSKYFQLNEQGDSYDTKEKEEFDKALEKVLTTEPTPLPPSTVAVLPTEPLCFNKLLLSDTFDSQLFSTQTQKKGAYTVKTVSPSGDDTFVNLVETDSTVLWKAQQTDQLWKLATMALSTDVGLLDLVFTENSKDVHSYFMFQKNEWKKVESAAYLKELAKVPGHQVQQTLQSARPGQVATEAPPGPVATEAPPVQQQGQTAASPGLSATESTTSQLTSQTPAMGTAPPEGSTGKTPQVTSAQPSSSTSESGQQSGEASSQSPQAS